MDGTTLVKWPDKHRAGTYAAWAFFVASPFLLLGILSLVLGKSVLSSTPVWTDELDYWRSVYSWLHVGANAGYSGIGELHAAVGTLSVHGLTPLLLYAAPAALFGWSYASIVLINGLWVSLGALTFCLSVKPKAGMAVAIGIALMVYAPVILYAATSMTEMANYGMLLFYLAFLVRLVAVRARAKANGTPGLAVGLPSLILASLALMLCILYRITYIGLWIPLVLAACDFRRSGKMLAYFALALLLSVGAYVLTSRYTSPFETGFLYNFLRTGSVSLSLQMFFSHAKANLMDYFTFTQGHMMEAVQRLLYCVVTGVALLGSFVRLRREGGRLRIRLGLGGFSLLMFMMLAIPFAMVVCFYETNDWSDYRTLAPFLWLAVVAAILRGRRFVPAVFVAGSVLVLAVLLSIPPVGMFADERRFTSGKFWAPRQELISTVVYDPAATDPFDNAVRTDMYSLATVALLDPGMGIQSGWFTESNVGKSRWILTDYLKIPLEGYELVLKNKAGSVYRRLDTATQN